MVPASARPLLLASVLLSACAAAPPPSPVAAAPPPAAPVPPAPPPPYGSAAQLGGWIDAHVSAFGARWGEAYAAQCYLTVADGGKVVFERAYGKADRERGRVAGADTRFRIGSLTKQFTAAAILKLDNRGLLRVEDPIRKHLPEYPAAGDRITIHHLLTHTSGIPNYTEDEALMKHRSSPITRAEMLAAFQDKPLLFEPGSQHRYSNSNYFVLGVIVERLSGRTYEDFLQENVLRPAGMTRTSTVDAPDAPDTAVGYEPGPDDALVPSGAIDMSRPFSAGALRSTARDLLAWDRALAGEAVLDEASKARMFTPFKDGYAYGWGVDTMEDKRVVSHSGGIDGFTSYIARAPEAKLAVVALCNNSGFPAGKIGQPALRMALSGKPVPPVVERAVVPLDPARIRGLVGEYTLTDASRKELESKIPAPVVQSVLSLTLSAEGERLYMKPVGQGRHEVFGGEGGGLFTKQARPVEITAEPGEKPDAPARGVTLTQAGIGFRYVRAAPADDAKDKAKKGAPPKGPKR
jgi:CubicO group peptidase (beta-lactamase class C family)